MTKDHAWGVPAEVALAIPGLRIEAGPVPHDLGLGPVVSPGAEWKDVEGRTAVRTAIHDRGASIELVGVGVYAIPADGDGVQAWGAGGRSADSVAREFDRAALPLVLAYRGAQYLHASAIATGGGVYALCGRSGTGKSTLAAALVRAGCELWADDAVVFAAPDGGHPLAVRLPAMLRLDEAGVGLVDQVGSGDPSQEQPPGALRPLAGVVVLERADAGMGPRLDRIEAGTALAALLEHALCFTLEGNHRERLVGDYLALLERVSVSRLAFAPGPSSFESLVRLLLAHLG